jgi:N-acetylmuramoyl-L-alanine amidase
MRVLYLVLLITLLHFIHTQSVGEELKRSYDEIVVCGRLFHIGVPVVTWMDEGGYDSYRVECRFSKFNESDYANCAKGKSQASPNRYGIRPVKDEETREKIRGGGWTLDILRQYVNKFVIHFDAGGYSKNCFKWIHDNVFLSVHFMLDVDGTIYQALDVKEMAWTQGSVANPVSIGIEIANIGAYPVTQRFNFSKWYTKDEKGMRLVLPPNNWVRTPNFVGRPIRNELIRGEIHNTLYEQMDFTREQYKALIHLTAAIHKIFPNIPLDYPRDSNGQLLRRELTRQEFDNFRGVLGHFHITKSKNDPGPAFQWDLVINEARKLVQK